MGNVVFRGRALPCEPGQTVLSCLEAHGIVVPSSCRAGVCQSCLMKAPPGAAPAAAQKGLKESWRAQGLFLACQCVPEGSLEVSFADEAEVRPATLVFREQLADDVWQLMLRCEAGLGHQAGQFVNLVRDDGLVRSYSVASLPERSGLLELHVRHVPGGRMSSWLCHELPVDGQVGVRGPAGECFYVADPEQQLILAGTSTGLAPLLGVVRDALVSGHQGPITLYHGARQASGLYLGPQLEALARAHPQLEVVRCVLEGPAPDGVIVGALDALILARHPTLDGAKAWLCGAPGFVVPLRRELFLAGLPLRDIASDPFLPSTPG